ncbi:MAG: hypothetical protein M5R36_20135 [Deltaproteobacteria bacterium]|nr:hypothetical protein [Deltaproteobacteria bacterium]
MAPFPHRVTLGRSGLEVSPLAVAGGYGVDRDSLLRAFDRGVNYWYHGSRRPSGMRDAVRAVKAAGHRDDLVLVLQSYSRIPSVMEATFTRGLKTLHLDYADVLLLGWFDHGPSDAVLEGAERMREKGLYKRLAISCHHRPTFVKYAKDTRYDILHVRYNAAHTGAEKDIFPHLSPDHRPGTVAYTATRWGQLTRSKLMPPGENPLRGRDCYRFVLSNPDFNVCMTGPKNAAEMDEALAALDDGPLSPDEEERVRRIGQHVRGASSVRSIVFGR